MIELSWLLIAAPLLSAAVLIGLGRRADRWGHWLGVATLADIPKLLEIARRRER